MLVNLTSLITIKNDFLYVDEDLFWVQPFLSTRQLPPSTDTLEEACILEWEESFGSDRLVFQKR